MKATVEHVQLQFIKEIDNNVCSLRVERNIMCFALKSGHLFLIDLDTPSNVTKYRFQQLSSPQEKLLKVWMNPSATTLLLKTNFAKYYACEVASLEQGKGAILHLKKLSKKNCDVNTVIWQDSSQFICGTTEGKVYTVNAQSESSVSRLYSSPDPIDGIVFQKPPTGKECAFLASGQTIKYWSSATTPLRTFAETSPTEVEQFEQPKDSTGKKFTFYKDAFAWSIEPGIVFGTVQTQSDVLKSAMVLLNMELPQSNHRIKDIALSEFHLLLLRGNEILIINKLNNKLVWRKTIWSQGNEKILELVVDHSQSPPTFWCYSNTNIYEIVLKDESSGIWKLLAEAGKYDEALALPGNTPEEESYIYQQKGDYYFSENSFQEAAKCYGKSSSITVAEVALKFMKISNVAALQTFLTTKLKGYRKADGSWVQTTLMTDWIVWNYMQLLSDVDESIASEQDVTKLDDLHSQKDTLNSGLFAFFEENINLLDRDTIYQIMSHQNRKLEVLNFARLIEDHRFVLSYWIRSKNWYESLKVLTMTQDVECAYKYATTLLVNSPDSTINTWMQIEHINPSELISALLTYFANYQKAVCIAGSSRHEPNYALRYLKWCIQEREASEELDPIIYNSAIYMMIAGFEAHQNETEIIDFIESNRNYFDNDFVLRLSIKFKRYKTCIYLYSQLRLYEDAVAVALDKDLLEDAKLVASSPELDENLRLRRKLWLKIAKSMIAQQNDIKQTIKAILEDSNEVLTIRDLLPLFDEFTTIANVKDDLVRSLERHNSVMVNVSLEIEKSIRIKKEIAEDIKALKTRYQKLVPGASCDCCSRVLQTRKFYVFPCGHSFHTDCLMKAILKSTDYGLRNKIEAFQRKAAKSKESVDREELDRLLSTKCCLCSNIKINSIDEPLEANENERLAWAM